MTHALTPGMTGNNISSFDWKAWWGHFDFKTFWLNSKNSFLSHRPS
jgi:hypothetical protein